MWLECRWWPLEMRCVGRSYVGLKLNERLTDTGSSFATHERDPRLFMSIVSPSPSRYRRGVFGPRMICHPAQPWGPSAGDGYGDALLALVGIVSCFLLSLFSHECLFAYRTPCNKAAGKRSPSAPEPLVLGFNLLPGTVCSWLPNLPFYTTDPNTVGGGLTPCPSPRFLETHFASTPAGNGSGLRDQQGW